MTYGAISAMLEHQALGYPERRLLIDSTGDEYTTEDVFVLVLAAARWLRQRGVEPTMTVAWQLPAHVPAAVLTLALPRTCLRQAPIIHIYRQREVRAALESAGADVLIVDASTAMNAPADADVIVIPEDWLDELTVSSGTPDSGYGPSQPSTAAWIYFTSGSSGSPKAVTHTDSTLLTAVDGFRRHLGLGTVPDEVTTIAYPIAHIGGMMMLGSAIAAGFSVLMVPKVDPVTLPDTLARHRVTVTGGSPTHYQILLSAQRGHSKSRPLIPSLRMLTGGGAPCPPALHHEVREHLKVPAVHAYGMTEAAMICVSKYSDTDEQQCNSSGAPIPGVEIRIADNDEIQIRGSNVTPGYLDVERWNEAKTPDGWFGTGDCGHFRPDRRLVITGRLKDLIIRKGENIAPDVVEEELIAHPLVENVAVLGQPAPLGGELVCAVVQRNPSGRDVTLAELCAFLDQRGVMRQMWPERLFVVDEFPMTGLGKIARTELARQIGERQ